MPWPHRRAEAKETVENTEEDEAKEKAPVETAKKTKEEQKRDAQFGNENLGCFQTADSILCETFRR